MFMLVTVDRFREAIKPDDSESDEIIAFYISAASRAVVRYLQGQAGDLLSIDSPPDSPTNDLDEVPEDIALATLVLTGHFFRYRDGDEDKAFEDHELPRPVVALLRHYRDPTMA